MSANDHERRVIRDAMDRLLAGEPIRSDGKLTVKSLAVEANVMRWLLTEKHTDLQDEFRDKVRTQGATPDAIRALATENVDLKQRLTRVRTDRQLALARLQRCNRLIRALVLEKAQLEERLRGGATGVTPIRGEEQPGA